MTLDEHSSLWLEDKGWNESLKEFRVHCKLCNKDMQCRKETIKSHPNGDSHKKHLARALEKQRGIAHMAAGLAGLGARLQENREKQSVSPELTTQFRAVFKALYLGRPMSDLKHEPAYLRLQGCTHVPDAHWSHTAIWEIAEAIDYIIVMKDRELLKASPFYSASFDEATALGNMNLMCSHLHVMNGWKRTPVFMQLAEVGEF